MRYQTLPPPYRRYTPWYMNQNLHGAAMATGAYVANKFFPKGGYKSKRSYPPKKRYPNKPRRVFPRTKTSLRKQIKEVKRLAESDMGTLIYRDFEASQVKSAANQQSADVRVGISTSEIVEAIAQLRYYDPTAPTSLVVADFDSGSYQKEVLFNKAYSKVTCINNYQVPAKVAIYTCCPKADTSINPSTAWSNGLSDMCNGTINSVNVYPSDSTQFNDLWRIVKTTKRILKPGGYMSQSYSVKDFQYDPSLVDSHTFAFQKKFKAFVFLIVVEGIVGHDSAVTTEQGNLAGGVDTQLDRTFEIKYSAGADIKYVYVTEANSTFTNGGVVSNMPVADNQGYSLA